MKLLSSLGLASLAVAAAVGQHVATAWTISSSNATQPEEVLGRHQEFTKTWTISGAEPLAAIRLAAAGPVFVDYDAALNGASPTTDAPTDAPTVPPTDVPTVTPTDAPTAAPTDAPTEAPLAGSGSGSTLGLLTGVVSFNEVSDKVLAKIVLSGNCTKLLDAFEVVEHYGELKVQFKNQDFTGYGFVLTQIYVGEKDTLASVVTSGSSGVYISEGVLVSTNTSAHVDLRVSGDGDLFVAAPSTAFSVKSLGLKISGSGDVQFNAASLTLGDALVSTISGDGDIAVVTKSVDVNNTISSKISGAGDIFVQSANVTTFSLVSKVSGDGDITVSTNGSAVTQDVTISGVGNVATGSIAAVDTKVRLSGEGSVLVQTSHTLRVPHELNGKVQYVGEAPQNITDGRPPRAPKKPKHPKHRKHHGWGWWWGGDEDDEDEDSYDRYEDDDSDRFLPKIVTQAPKNEFKTYELRDTPAREPTFLILELNENRWSHGEPHEEVVITIGGLQFSGPIAAQAQALAAVRLPQQHPIVRGLFFSGFAAVALSAVGIAAHKLVTRHRRREYQPLLQVVTN